MVDRGVGNFRAPHGCPICLADNGGKWTCPSCTVLVDTHRQLIRHLQDWEVLFEACEVPDVLTSGDGRDYALWDVQQFYGYRSLVPERMQQAIQFCLFEGKTEREAAVMMGIAETNPVSTYATVGLTTLLTKASEGELPNYRIEISYPSYPMQVAS